MSTPDTGPAEETTAAAVLPFQYGARIVNALEHAWMAIRNRHPEVPRVVLITGTKYQTGGPRRGHFCPDIWDARGDGRASELFIAGEEIARGGRAVLETMLHEAAHGLAHVRDIKDTSGSGNRYHNRKFAALAEELGLKPPTAHVPTHGYSNCTVTDATAALYPGIIEALDAAGLPFLGTPAPPTVNTGQDDGPEGTQDLPTQPTRQRDRGPREGRRFAVVCGCPNPRRLQVTPATYEAGGIVCAVCGSPFAPVNAASP
ncbi:hypothetical protein [Streptomyces luteireticuli]|uniref:SprT-like domain-containing protein n=1 Tax=Streptomyces luteireticuli TaxID=173858 RepID=A0ABP3J4U2_9ACTN